jgi:hypothetical protein
MEDSNEKPPVFFAPFFDFAMLIPSPSIAVSILSYIAGALNFFGAPVNQGHVKRKAAKYAKEESKEEN